MAIETILEMLMDVEEDLRMRGLLDDVGSLLVGQLAGHLERAIEDRPKDYLENNAHTLLQAACTIGRLHGWATHLADDDDAREFRAVAMNLLAMMEGLHVRQEAA